MTDLSNIATCNDNTDRATKLNIIKEKWTKESKFDKHYNSVLDRKIASYCDPVAADIVLALDKNREIIVGLFAEAVQKLFPPGTLQAVIQGMETFTFLWPHAKPDPLRHPTIYSDHLSHHPDYNLKTTRDPHRAICATDHIGMHHPTGQQAHFDLCWQDYKLAGHLTTKDKRDLRSSYAWTVAHPKQFHGPYGFGVKSLRLTLKPWDPSVYLRGCAINAMLPPKFRFEPATTGDNPWHYLAVLYQTLTEGHTDDTEAYNGLASIMVLGDYTEGDLVLKELGLRIACPPGSHFHLRGHELHHFVMPHTGSRMAMVFVQKQDIVKGWLWFRQKIDSIKENAATNKGVDSSKLTVLQLQARTLSLAGKDDWEYFQMLLNELKAEEGRLGRVKGAPRVELDAVAAKFEL